MKQIVRSNRWAQMGFAVIVGISLYYPYRAISYRFLTPGRLGPSLFNKQIWYFTHVIFALPVLFGGPILFVS